MLPTMSGEQVSAAEIKIMKYSSFYAFFLTSFLSSSAFESLSLISSGVGSIRKAKVAKF
jgi:hypothetical protein